MSKHLLSLRGYTCRVIDGCKDDQWHNSCGFGYMLVMDLCIVQRAHSACIMHFIICTLLTPPIMVTVSTMDAILEFQEYSPFPGRYMAAPTFPELCT